MGQIDVTRYSISLAGVAELADALDSKSSVRKDVWVRVPPPVLFHSKDLRQIASDLALLISGLVETKRGHNCFCIEFASR